MNKGHEGAALLHLLKLLGLALLRITAISLAFILKLTGLILSKMGDLCGKLTGHKGHH